MTQPEPPQNIVLIRDDQHYPLESVYDGMQDDVHVWTITTPIDVQPTDRITVDVLPAHTAIRFLMPDPDDQGTPTRTRTRLGIYIGSTLAAAGVAGGLSALINQVMTPGPVTVVASVVAGLAIGTIAGRTAWKLTRPGR